MTTFDYVLDTALVLLVLLQIKERPLTNRQLVRPLVIAAIIVANYLDGVPTAGNDLVLVGSLALLGGMIGVGSGRAALMRRGDDGQVVSRAGWVSGFLWVLGMGSRLAFLVWMTHGGVAPVTRFSADHAITGQEAWTVALLAMAVAEVCGRTAILAIRRQSLRGTQALAPAV